MNEKTQRGDQGVATAVLHYTKNKYVVSVPNTEQCKYDLIVDKGLLYRVQVKTTIFKIAGCDSYIVQLRTNGANYTTKNNSTKISSDNVDLLFVLDKDGYCYEIPVKVVAGKSTISLGKQVEVYKVGRYAGIA